MLAALVAAAGLMGAGGAGGAQRRHPPLSQQMPSDQEGWMTSLSPNQFAVLRQGATEPPGFSELTEGELEFELKKNYRTKYPQEGAYACVGW